MNWETLVEPLAFPLDPAKRIYWACLVSSLLLASAAVTWQQRRFQPWRQLRALCSRRYWLNRSSLADCGLMFFNHALRAMLLLPLAGGALGVTLATGRLLQTHLGDAPNLALPGVAVACLYALTLFLAEDASRYFLHLALHRCKWLWRFHRVHHSASNLTPLTLFRVHPVEAALAFARGTLVFGTVSGLFVWLFGRQLATFDILGVGVLGFLFNLAGANLRHSPIWLSFGPLERWLISPAQHQLHHSASHGHPNLGSALAIWDRWMGTFQAAGPRRRLTFGLPATAS